MRHDAWGPGTWIGMSIAMLVFWGLVIALVIWVAQWATSNRARNGGAPAVLPAQPPTVAMPTVAMPAAGEPVPAAPAPPAAAAPAAAAVPPASSGALHILAERFARGEIDEEEYVRRRDLILGR